MRIISLIQDPDVIRRILEHLGLRRQYMGSRCNKPKPGYGSVVHEDFDDDWPGYEEAIITFTEKGATAAKRVNLCCRSTIHACYTSRRTKNIIWWSLDSPIQIVIHDFHFIGVGKDEVWENFRSTIQRSLVKLLPNTWKAISYHLEITYPYRVTLYSIPFRGGC